MSLNKIDKRTLQLEKAEIMGLAEGELPELELLSLSREARYDEHKKQFERSMDTPKYPTVRWDLGATVQPSS